jgi:hypothetical protein
MRRTAWDVVSAHETKDGTGITNTAQFGQKNGEVRGRAHGSLSSKPEQIDLHVPNCCGRMRGRPITSGGAGVLPIYAVPAEACDRAPRKPDSSP